MAVKLTLKNKNYCDGCAQLTDLHTLGGHKRCKLYKKNMLPQEDIFIANKGLGYLSRLDVCKEENEAEVKR